MTVKEAIEQLKLLPENLEIYIYDCEQGMFPVDKFIKHVDEDGISYIEVT